MSANYTILLS